MYTAARFIIYFCVSPCDESGLKQVQRNPSPLPVVRRACYTQGCRTRVVHHVRTTVERDARTRRKQRHVVVTKATLIYERCSVSRVDGLAITRNEGQFVSRLARTVVVSFSLLPPPSPPSSPSSFVIEIREKFGNFDYSPYLPHQRVEGTDRLLLYIAHVRDGTMQLEESS